MSLRALDTNEPLERFLAGILLILALALLTIGSQTLKADYTNPVDTLRSEY
ncbi:MAG TPA: hypothetical protein VKP65_17930 [Rhodothermales bacterium]|nr:hypothetical protein [Rhodothermales bacterium]